MKEKIHSPELADSFPDNVDNTIYFEVAADIVETILDGYSSDPSRFHEYNELFKERPMESYLKEIKTLIQSLETRLVDENEREIAKAKIDFLWNEILQSKNPDAQK